MRRSAVPYVDHVLEDHPDWETGGPELLYAQVADHIASLAADGALKPGTRLPAERDMAAELGVAYLTVRRAMRVLRDRGIVVTVQGRGTYIAR